MTSKPAQACFTIVVRVFTSTVDCLTLSQLPKIDDFIAKVNKVGHCQRHDPCLLDGNKTVIVGITLFLVVSRLKKVESRRFKVFFLKSLAFKNP